MAVLATSSAAVKRCVACGRDVAGTKRMKDSQGRYWCVDCGEADLKKKAKTSASASRSGPGLFERIVSIKESFSGGGGQTSKGRLIGMLVLAGALAAIAGWQFLSRHS